jgi:hypothetical protein
MALGYCRQVLYSVMAGISLLSVHSSLIANDLKILQTNRCMDGVKRPPPANMNLRVFRDGFLSGAHFVDFSGDGMCDYLAIVPFPYNVMRSESYWLKEIALLGTKKTGWKKLDHPYKDRNKDPFSYRPDGAMIEAGHEVDAGGAVFLDRGRGLPPFVLGLINEQSTLLAHRTGCRPLITVHLWSDDAQVFLRLSETKEQEILHYYYANLAKPCPRK